MKKSKKNYVAIVLVVLLVAMAVGYAAFSGSISISGTANASGKWDVKFTNADITDSIVTGTTENTATVQGEGESIDVSVNLATPGDGATITATIANKGSYDAKLTGFSVVGDGFTETSTGSGVWKKGAILVKVPTMTTDGSDVIKAGESKTFKFSVEWDEDVTDLGVEKQTTAFTITFDYEQANVTGTFNGVQDYNNTIQ